MVKSEIVGIIPARYNSSRFPGKMLRDILGKSLIRRSYENACRAKLFDEVIVATDDSRIYDHVVEFGGRAVMSSSECRSGTDRVAEVVRVYGVEADIVVNIQGDEPCLQPEVIRKLVETLQANESAVITTPVARIDEGRDIFDPSVVKCVFDSTGKALYFSRSPIPFPGKNDETTGYFRHLGVYCFRREFLLKVAELAETPLQKREDLEQLKVLESGYPIHVCIVEDSAIGVDTVEDLKRVEERLCLENTSLSQGVSSLR